MKRIDKDLLDMEKVRADLLYDLTGNWILHLITPLAIAFLVGLIHLACATEYAGDIPEVVLHRVIPLLWLLPTGYLTGYGVSILCKWLRGTKATLSITEDTLCKINAITTYKGWDRPHHSPSVYYPRYYWVLQFSEHGKYTMRAHATWNEKYRINSNDIYRRFEPGDTFYLLLRGQGQKGKKPKILLAYPCKYFEWKD